MDTFQALLIQESDGQFTKEIVSMPLQKLPESDLLIKVSYSSINYKDALSASGNKGVTRKYPHVPGIDAAGTVISSRSDRFIPGQQVLVTGYDLGMNTWGGFGQYISIPEKWALHLPTGLTAKEAMCLGTAGLTAGLSVQQLLESGITPEAGPLVVSGASGGVGSLSVAILSKLGFEVVAITSKQDEAFFKGLLGANALMDRTDFIEKYDKRALSATDFGGAVDTVGGPILSGMLKSTRYGGAVTCCGMVASPALETSVFPFILRGVRLIGIDSVELPLAKKETVWNMLANEWKPVHLAELVTEVSLNTLPAALNSLLKGEMKGRALVVLPE